ncbi:MAG TPA: DUF1501 domain-containing protein [Propionicimonas sp.]|uniref:DUF1501 domain-containing protein n=1 Tax=Propionicimonas sp. TaxID=1955623 RepID=UPI002F3EBEFC
MTTNSPDDTLRRGEALLHEDLITPLHDHEESRNRLLAHIDGSTRVVTPEQANSLVAVKRANKGITEVEHTPTGPRFARRGLFRGSLIGLGGLLAASAAPRYSFAAGTGRDLLVCVFLRGGFDGLSAVGPVGDAAYNKARGRLRIDSGLALGSTHVLNKNFAALNPVWNAGEMAVVLGSGHPDVTRSHFEDQDLCERAAKANVRSGWIGRHIASSSDPSGTFRAITIGSRVVMSLTTTAYQSLAMSSVASFTLESSWNDGTQLMTDLQAVYGDTGGVMAGQVKATLDAVTSLDTIRTQTYRPANGAVYDKDSSWHTGLQDIARLAKADLGMEVACIDYGGWDMHQNIGLPTDAQGPFSIMAKDFATGLAAFRTDLGSRWKTVTVVTMSEFGRRVELNGDGGADHGHGNVMFLMGGGIKGGKVYGTMPTLTSGNLDDGDVPITTDYRQPLSEIVSKRLRNDRLAEVFPGFTPKAPLGIA